MSGIKLSYLEAQRRVRCEFSKADTLRSEDPPLDLLARAKKKLELEKYRGSIDFYHLYAARLKKMWNLMRQSWEENDVTVAVTLGAGSPKLDGLVIKPAKKVGSLCMISFDVPPKTLKTWRFHFLKLTVGEYLLTNRIKGVVNPAELHSAWYRGCAGEQIQDFVIHSIPDFKNIHKRRQQPYDIRVNASHKNITAIVYDVVGLLDLDLWTHMKEEIQEKVQGQSKEAGVTYTLLLDDLIRALRSAKRGPERYGIDLPFVQLIACPKPIIDHQQQSTPIGEAAAAKAGARATDMPKERAAAPSGISFDIIDDQMSAVIKGFDKKLYDSGKINAEWLISQAKAQKVVAGFEPDIINKINELLLKKEDLNGAVIAQGSSPRAGEQPFLKAVFQESHGSTDLRDRARKFVNKGQLVAEIAYAKEPLEGITVTGKVTPAPESEEKLTVTVGEGVEQKEDKFYSTVDGTPEVTDTNVLVKEGYVHEGNVNLASGNIEMGGDVQIDGSIEQGSSVKVAGNLTITGDVSGGFISVGGDLVIEGGVITGEGGMIVCKGSMSCSHIENSTIYVNKVLTVKKSIMYSHISCQDKIILAEDDGIVSGGTIVFGNEMKVGKLGADRGSKTKIQGDVDWKMMRKYQTQKHRLERITKMLEQYKGDITELKGRKSKLKDDKIELLEKRQKGLTTLKKLVKDLTLIVPELEPQVYLDGKPRILVVNELSSNCDIMIGKNPVKASDDLAGVMIDSNRVNGSFVHRIEDAKEEKSDSKDEDKKSDSAA